MRTMSFRIPLAISTLLVAGTLSAQTAQIRQGNKAFDRLAYHDAIGHYERAAEEGAVDSTFVLRLAQSSLLVRDFARAEKWYARGVMLPQAQAKDIYDYAQVLRANGKYAEADTWLQRYEQRATGDSRAQRQSGSTTYATRLRDQTIPGCVVKDLNMNSAFSDMGAAITKGGVVFASARRPDVAESRRHTWNGQPFLDLYFATPGTDGEWQVSDDMNELNTKYHESNAAFSPDGSTVWFTRNNYFKGKKGVTPQDEVNLKIYSRRLVNGKWTYEQPFTYNSDASSVGHPALSADGRTLFFTSDRPGGVGGTDIWLCAQQGESWSAPVCLGSEVNTEGNEMFPWISADGTLFFASDGHQGLGGLDILYSKMDASGMVGKARNPGAPLNSDHDDFALVLRSDGRSGYFTSDRPGGKGDDDIYSVALVKPLSAAMRVEGVVSDRNSKAPLLGSTVTLKDAQGKVVATTTTGADGGYGFDVEAAQNYWLEGAQASFKGEQATLRTGAEADTTYKKDLTLAAMRNTTLRLNVTDARTNAPLEGVDVQVLDLLNNNSEVLDGKTDLKGDLSTGVGEKPVGETLTYRIRLSKPGYFPKRTVFDQPMPDADEVLVHRSINLSMEQIEVGMDVGKVIEINPIYFDLGKWNIRPDAATELDKIVSVLNDNPAMVIELGSHTDSRGSDASNLSLSDKRAKSSAAYIVSKGIPKARIQGKGYGEKKLLNRCTNGVKCSEEEHQLNRRTEFIIVKM